MSRNKEKTYLGTCASNEDLNQPVYSRSLIRVSVVLTKKVCTLVIQNATGEDSVQSVRIFPAVFHGYFYDVKPMMDICVRIYTDCYTSSAISKSGCLSLRVILFALRGMYLLE